MKKLLSLLLVTTLALTMFCGCGKDDVNDSNPPQNESKQEVVNQTTDDSKDTTVNEGEVSAPTVTEVPEVTATPTPVPVTAESLLKGVDNDKDNGKMDINMVLDLAMEAEDGGQKISTSMKVDAAILIEYDEFTSHMMGLIKMNMLGIEMELPAEQYAVKDGHRITTYDYDADEDAWYYTEDDVSEYAVDFESFTELDTSIFKDLVLDETKPDVYLVNATVDYSDFAEQYEMDMSDLIGDADEIDYDKLKFEVVFEFDKASKLLKTMSFDVDPSIFESIDLEESGLTGLTLNEFSFVFKFDTSGKDIEVSIPKDILDNAIDLGSYYESDWDDGYYSGDEGYTSEDAEDWYSDYEDDTDSMRDASQTYRATAEWTKLEFYVNGVEFCVGDSVSNLVDAGFAIDDVWDEGFDLDWDVNRGQIVEDISFRHPSAPELHIKVDVKNTEGNSVKLRDCAIVDFYASRYDGKPNAFEFCDSVQFGDSLEDVLTYFGSPDSEYDYGTSWSGYWYSDDCDYSLSISVSEENGVETIYVSGY